MRTLGMDELDFVAGGIGRCTPWTASYGNFYGGVSQPSSVGNDLISIYEGLVFATSHIIERVANAF